MQVDLQKLEKDQLILLIGKQSRRLLDVNKKLEQAYRALAHHDCKGTQCTKCGGVK